MAQLTKLKCSKKSKRLLHFYCDGMEGGGRERGERGGGGSFSLVKINMATALINRGR